jgi:hypothetical protein
MGVDIVEVFLVHHAWNTNRNINSALFLKGQ